MSEPTEREMLPQHDDIPQEVRMLTHALVARVESVRRCLSAPSAMPLIIARCQEELVHIAAEALAIRALLP